MADRAAALGRKGSRVRRIANAVIIVTWTITLAKTSAAGFREPESWLDEYRRIYKLFETHLKD